MPQLIERRLRAEERRHREGVPGQRRDVADLLLAAAEEIEQLRYCVDLILHHITPHADDKHASRLAVFIKEQCETALKPRPLHAPQRNL